MSFSKQHGFRDDAENILVWQWIPRWKISAVGAPAEFSLVC
jgi:hypothetical protein